MKNLCVLLIDDDKRVLPFVQEHLAPFVMALRVHHALSMRDGLGALSLAECAGNNCPDVVITDLKMGDCKNLEAPRAIREQFPAMPLVILTGTYARDEAIDDGFFDFVSKDCVVNAARSQELFGRVRVAMDRAMVREIGSGRIPVSCGRFSSAAPPAAMKHG